MKEYILQHDPRIYLQIFKENGQELGEGGYAMSAPIIDVRRFGTSGKARGSIINQCLDSGILTNLKDYPRCLDGRVCSVHLRGKQIMCVAHVCTIDMCDSDCVLLGVSCTHYTGTPPDQNLGIGSTTKEHLWFSPLEDCL